MQTKEKNYGQSNVARASTEFSSFQYDFRSKPLGRTIFFLKREQKLYSNLLIKKKRIALLIYGKPGENQYKQTTTTPKSRNPTLSCKQPNTLSNAQQLQPLHMNNSRKLSIRTHPLLAMRSTTST
jgi:hypothetical protein